MPPGGRALGIPAKVLPGGEDQADLAAGAAVYVANGKRYRDQLRRID